jgi:hypothetical protein
VWYGIGPVVGCCEHGNELSGSIKKAGNFLAAKTFLALQWEMCCKKLQYRRVQWCTEGGVWGVQPPPPRNSEVLQSRTGLQMERKMFSVPIPAS